MIFLDFLGISPFARWKFCPHPAAIRIVRGMVCGDRAMSTAGIVLPLGRERWPETVRLHCQATCVQILWKFIYVFPLLWPIFCMFCVARFFCTVAARFCNPQTYNSLRVSLPMRRGPRGPRAQGPWGPRGRTAGIVLPVRRERWPETVRLDCQASHA